MIQNLISQLAIKIIANHDFKTILLNTVEIGQYIEEKIHNEFYEYGDVSDVRFISPMEVAGLMHVGGSEFSFHQEKGE